MTMTGGQVEDAVAGAPASRGRRRGTLAAMLLGAVVGSLVMGCSSAPRAAPTTDTTSRTSGSFSPTGAAHPTATTIATPLPPGAGAGTTSTTVALSPAAVAERVTVAYLAAPSAAARRVACRPYDTGRLDSLLADPGYSGQGPTTTAAAPLTVTVATPVAADTTATAIGFEIAATVKGSSRPVAVSVRVVRGADDRWLADTLTVAGV